AAFDLDRVNSAGAFRVPISLINQFERRDFMRQSQVQTDETMFAAKIERLAEFIRRDLETRALHVDLAVFERGFLHVRRKRVRHRTAENAKANGIPPRSLPAPEISQSEALLHGRNKPAGRRKRKTESSV